MQENRFRRLKSELYMDLKYLDHVDLCYRMEGSSEVDIH